MNNKIIRLQEEIKKWQVEVMGNKCTICHGNNVMAECSACGWWGRVEPKTKANKCMYQHPHQGFCEWHN